MKTENKKIKAINKFYNSINNPKNKTLNATAISFRTVPSFGENTICKSFRSL